MVLLAMAYHKMWPIACASRAHIKKVFCSPSSFFTPFLQPVPSIYAEAVTFSFNINVLVCGMH